MTITLEFPPDQQAALERRAAASGMDVPMLIWTLVRDDLADAEASDVSMTDEAWQAEFSAFIARQRSRNPNVDDSRESIYR